MTTVTMQALPGHLVDDPNSAFTSMVVEYLGDTYGRRKAEAANPTELGTAVKAFGDEVAAARPGVSFYVSVSPDRGTRKFRGYDAADNSDAFGTKAWMKVLTKANYVDVGLQAEAA